MKTDTFAEETETQQKALGSPQRWRERIRALKNLPPVMKIVWEAAPGVVAGGAATRIFSALIPVAMVAVTKWIIDGIEALKLHPLPTHFWWLVGIEFGLACLLTVLMRLTDFCDAVMADRFMHHTSLRVMKHASHLDLSSYEDSAVYDKMERARVQSTDRIGMIQETGRLMQQAIAALGFGATIFLYSKILLLALVVCIVPAFLFETHFAFLSYWLSFRQTPRRRELDYLRLLGGSRESAKELKLFGLSSFLADRYKGISEGLHGETVGLARRKLMIGANLTLLGTMGYYGSYAWVIYETVAGRFTIGELTLLAGAIAGASTNIQAVFSSFSSIANQSLFLADLLEFFSVKPKVHSKPNAVPAPRRIEQGFEFRNVSFAYPGKSRVVLNNISFRLEPKSRIALVGENGQGKTTIVKLLTRLYDPTAGQILLDGVDLREYDLESLWKQIGVIFQDFTRYEMTASENIGVGQIEEVANPFRIRAAANKSLAENVIRQLPRGYDQVLGCRFDGGVDLSGGEWQRLALARAYLRDAQVLILDEPTAALDARSEHEVFERFAELTRGKMALLISHRFSTVRMADRILVLENGKIAEQGHHDQLVACSGRYREMFELQAASYR
ncbi:MAG TPA: ABC transporter ATP-binding protein [Candidatus Cybelea sp.]|nr:ABC transporter ATP-binding protein [Candidatus Cybelea sp.]